MKETLTSFDLAAIVLELKEQLEGARIQNIYQTKGKILILKLHRSNRPTMNLLVEPGKRLHLTSYQIEKPQKPPSFCMALRKHLRNSVITEISQHKFERIFSLKARTREGEYCLLIELFGDGNAILVDPQGTIKQALRFKRMRDREILRGKPFRHAPSSGKSPLNVSSTDLSELKKQEGLEIVKALTKSLSISGQYSEEVLLRAHVDKTKRVETLQNKDIAQLSKAFDEVLSYLRTGKLHPCLVIDDAGIWIDVTPIPLQNYRNLKCKKFESFNEALDEYYTKASMELEVSTVTRRVEDEVSRQQRILEKQQASLEKTAKEAELMRKIGDTIYAHFHQLQTLLRRIIDEKQRGNTWQEILQKIEIEKARGDEPAVWLDSIDTRKLMMQMSLDNLTFSLNLRSSAQENASTYYGKAKKAEKKYRGAEKAIQTTRTRIEELKQRKHVAAREARKPTVKLKKKGWFEKFRWFYTSENLLVIGGKDAVTNEILIKKHSAKGDLVFHADIAGAPFVLVKTKGKAPSQQSILEAAQLAASHSRAWKSQFGALDVYWVHSEQVTKTPPSGHYLQKGAFIIRGKKNYVRRTPLRLAIGIDINTTPPTVIGGPTQAIDSRTNIYVEIAPGDLPSSKLAQEILHGLAAKTPKRLKQKVSKIPLESIQTFIPFGKGRIERQ